MKIALAMGREILGLFIDDGALALAILAIVGLAAAAAALAPETPLLAGAALLGGCLGALALNVLRAGR
jgi:hypothetical protein